MNAVSFRGRLAACLGVLLSASAGAASGAECPTINYSCEALDAPAVQRAGAATVMLHFPGADQCTGTLVNNARNDDRPFILTARHCATDTDEAGLPALAGAVQITYRRQASCSDGTRTAELVTYGAAHRAVYQDAWLIEALDPVPTAAAAYFAGLDVSGQNSGSRFGVHHGGAGTKQFVEQQVESGNILYLILGKLGIVASTWHTRLLSGSTPYGASGSGLFDGATRMSGVLSGGVICSGDIQGNDYQQLAVAWLGSGTDATGLQPWLDPDRNGLTIIEARAAGAAPSGGGGSDGGGGGAGGADSSSAGGGGSFALRGLWVMGLLAALRGRRTH